MAYNTEGSKRTVRSIAHEAIILGATNAQALEYVRKHFPSGRTSNPCIRFYRNELRKQRPDVLGNREIVRARRASGAYAH